VVCAFAAFAVLLSSMAKTCWGLIGNARPGVTVLVSLAFSAWIWLIVNESASELNNIFGLPGRDFPAAVTALTVLVTATLVLVFAALLLVLIEFLLLFVLKPVAESSKHQIVFINLSLSLIVALCVTSILMPTPLPLSRDVAIYMAFKFDFDGKVLCKSMVGDPENKQNNKRFYKFTNDSRTHVLSLVQTVDEPKNLFKRAKAATLSSAQEKLKVVDYQVTDYSRYFTDLKVQSCVYQ
jgi:hypothetical protein